MERKFLFILIFMLFWSHGCSGFYYQPPLAKFKHEKHVDVLFEQQKECTYCHNLPEVEETPSYGEDFQSIPDLAAYKVKIEGKCHSCHKEKTTRIVKAPRNCDTCHEYMKAMKPADHVNNWSRMHAVPAVLDEKACKDCHKQWYCESCHFQQKSLDTRMHTRTYRLKHSQEAILDPGSCDACHRVNFCIDCHQEG